MSNLALWFSLIAMAHHAWAQTCSGTVTLNAATGSFHDGAPGVAPPSTNVDCFWLIQPSPAVSTITLSFSTLSLSYMDVWVYDGSSQTAMELGHWNSGTAGLQNPAIVRSSGNAMLVRLKTGCCPGGEGFAATYHGGFCDQVDGTVNVNAWDSMIDMTLPAAGSFRANADCKWLIQDNSDYKRVSLFMDEYFLQGNAALRFYDGSSTAAPLLTQFTGTQTTTAKGLHIALPSAKTVLIHYVSGSGGGRGFRVRMNSMSCSGQSLYTEASNSFHDGALGVAAPDKNVDCLWLIQPSPIVPSITLSFSKLSLAYTDVWVYDGSTTSAAELGHWTDGTAGLQNPVTVRSSGTSILVRLKTGCCPGAEGFALTYYGGFCDQVDGTADIFAWSSMIDMVLPLAASFRPNADCKWLIQDNSDYKRVSLFIDEYFLQGDSSLRFYDGASTAAPLLTEFIGTQATTAKGLHIALPSAKTVFIRYQSGAGGGRGFRVRLDSRSCSGQSLYTEVTNSFHDGALGVAAPDKNVDCLWLIQPSPAVSSITLSFSRLSLAYTDVWVYDGSTTSAAELGHWTDGTAGLQNPVIVRSTGTSMLVRLKTGCCPGSEGFALTYHGDFCEKTDGTVTVNAWDSMIDMTLPAAGSFRANADCKWLIQDNSDYKRVSLFMDEYFLQGDSALRVYNGIIVAAPLLTEFIGTQATPAKGLHIALPTGKVALIHFQSNAGGGRGFRMRLNSMSCSGQSLYTESSNTFHDGALGTSPPDKNLDCLWLIQPVPAVSSITVSFTTLALAYVEVWVYDGPTTASAELGHWTATASPADLVSTGDSVLVRLKSNCCPGNQGFALRYCSACTPTITSVASPAGLPALGGVQATIHGECFCINSISAALAFAPLAVTWLSSSALRFTLPPGVGLVNPLVVTSRGVSSSTYNIAYSAPTVGSITPTSAGAAGGSTVTVDGLNFGGLDTSPQAFIDDQACLTTTWVSDARLTCVVPPGFGQLLNVKVTVSAQTSELIGAFSYSAPVITGLQPSEGAFLGSTVLTVLGQNFGGVSNSLSISIDGVACLQSSWISDSEATCLVPAGSKLVQLPVVITVDGQTSQPLTQFSYVYPSLTRAVPSSSLYVGGISVTVRGSFIPDTTNVSCIFYTPDSLWSVSRAGLFLNGDIVCQLPDATASLSPQPPTSTFTDTLIRLRVAAHETAGVPFRFTESPTLLSLLPTSGLGSGGTTVTLVGDKFTNTGSAVCRFFYGPSSVTVAATVLSVTSATCLSPDATTALGRVTGAISIEFSLNGVQFSNSQVYQLYSKHSVASIQPESGPTTGKTSVEVTGNFTGAVASDVRCVFDTELVQPSSVAIDRIVCLSPANMTAGSLPFNIALNGQDLADSSLAFQAYLPPVLQVITPAGGPTAVVTTVAIGGVNLIETGSIVCKFGSTIAPGQYSSAQKAVTCDAPTSPTQGPVSVSVSLNGKDFSLPVVFQYYLDPDLVSVEPASGPTVGTTLTAFGSNFRSEYGLVCGFTPAAGGAMTVVHADLQSGGQSLICTAPPLTAGAYLLRVSNNGQHFPTKQLPYAVFGCPAGFAQTNISTPCRPCPAGMASPGGSEACQFCGPGTRSLSGAAQCEPCPSGRKSAKLLGSEECVPCDNRFYQPAANSSTCLPCPEFTNTEVEFGGTSIEQCVCIRGFYRRDSKPGQPCTLCPEGANCKGGVEFPKPQAGFWVDQGRIFEGSEAEFYECSPAEACLPDGCAQGYEGRLCGLCSPGYFRVNESCSSCEEPGLLFIILAACLVAFLVLVGYVCVDKFGERLVAEFQRRTAIKVFITFLQTFALFAVIDHSWPGSTKSAMDYAGAFNLSMDFLHFECSLGQISYPVLWLIKMLIPTAVFFLIAVVYPAIATCLGKGSSAAGEQAYTLSDLLAAPLRKPYSTETWVGKYWEVALLLRKFVFVLMVKALGRYYQIRMTALLFFVTVALYMQSRVRPYEAKRVKKGRLHSFLSSYNAQEELSLWSLCILLVLGIAYNSSEQARNNRVSPDTIAAFIVLTVLFGMVVNAAFVLHDIFYPAAHAVTHLVPRNPREKSLDALFGLLALMYVYLTSTALDPFDCTRHPDGTVTLDSEPATDCDSATIVGLQVISALFFVFFGVGIFVAFVYVLSKSNDLGMAAASSTGTPVASKATSDEASGSRSPSESGKAKRRSKKDKGIEMAAMDVHVG